MPLVAISRGYLSRPGRGGGRALELRAEVECFEFSRCEEEKSARWVNAKLVDWLTGGLVGWMGFQNTGAQLIGLRASFAIGGLPTVAAQPDYTLVARQTWIPKNV